MERTELAVLRATFLREAEELLASAEDALAVLERDPSRRTELRTLCRAFHTLKSGAAAVGRSELEGALHRIEEALLPIRELERRMTPAVCAALFALLYTIRDAIVAGGADPGSRALALLEEAAGAAPALDRAPSNSFRVVLQYPGEQTLAGMDPSHVLLDVAEAAQIVRAELDRSSVLPLERLESPDHLSLRYVLEVETSKQIDELREAFFIFDQTIDVSIVPLAEESGDATKAEDDTVRVSAGKLDRLLNLSGEINITLSLLRGLVPRRSATDPLGEALVELERHGRALQEEILAARMTPLETLFRPFRRLVREIGAALGKQVRFETRGAEVELDRAIVDQMREPITHLIRNCLDHGLEAPAERRAAHKPEEGVVSLSADQREGSVYLTVEDDGKGLPRPDILRRARELGLLAPDVEPADEQIDELIFETGLSTARQVTNLSGRGIGMDIVRRSIERIRGEVAVSSRPGRGTRYRIRLPLTLALLQGVLLREDGRHYVAPSVAVEEAIALRSGSARKLANRGAFLVVRDEPVPLLRLSRPLEDDSAEELAALAGIALVLRFESRRVAIVVDDLIDQQQFVIKNIERNYQRLAGFTGAAILGDGQVALVLDPPMLVRSIETPGAGRREELHA